MTPATGQILRRTGLVIELLAMGGMVWRARGNPAFLSGLPFEPIQVLAAVFALGFGLWLTGTLTILSARNRRGD